MYKLFRHIPNTITSVNLFSGCIAIVALMNQEYATFLICLCISLIADFLDGFAARLLKAQSPIGKDLDSLADMVTFGVLPSMVLFYLAELNEHNTWNYLCFLVAVFSAIRLARFNHDTRQSYHFIGLPTPANALFITSLLIFMVYENPANSEHSALLKFNSVTLSKIIYSSTSIRGIAIAVSLMLISPIKMISLKFTKFKLSEIVHQIILFVGIFCLIFLFGILSIFWIMIWYLVWSVLWHYLIRK